MHEREYTDEAPMPLVIRIKPDRVGPRNYVWFVVGTLTGDNQLHCLYLRWRAERKHARAIQRLADEAGIR